MILPIYLVIGVVTKIDNYPFQRIYNPLAARCGFEIRKLTI